MDRRVLTSDRWLGGLVLVAAIVGLIALFHIPVWLAEDHAPSGAGPQVPGVEVAVASSSVIDRGAVLVWTGSSEPVAPNQVRAPLLVTAPDGIALPFGALAYPEVRATLLVTAPDGTAPPFDTLAYPVSGTCRHLRQSMLVTEGQPSITGGLGGTARLACAFRDNRREARWLSGDRLSWDVTLGRF